MDILKYKTIVIKIGSSLIVDGKNKIKKNWFNKLIEDIEFLIGKNKQIIIVSSGAIALGCDLLKINKKNTKLSQFQAIAAVGQIELINIFKKAFEKKKIKISQILLTLEDTEERRRSLNAKETINNLLKMSVIPIVNENDTVATSEIRYGDNDRLAARVAQICNANCLIMLSDINGLYSADPKKNKSAKIIKKVTTIDKSIELLASESISSYGTGGMITKIKAAKICMQSGCDMILTSGMINNPIKNIIKNKNYTLFESQSSTLNAKKQWILNSIATKGSIMIDEGAEKALKNGKSLLPIGVTAVEGNFNRGDAIYIINSKNKRIATGICAYSSLDAKKIIGFKTDKIKEILGYVSRGEIVHIDNLVYQAG
ncbi:MAG: glutamate 5-kinase [Candidatus Fonsibacter sp.]|nr:glutamate 5-kinase [Candidatus Fonsibacter sp.]